MKEFNRIMSGFDKTIKKLEALAVKKTAEKKETAREINLLKDKVSKIEIEEHAARETAANFKKYIMPGAK